jgi:hypothetical protein
LRQSFWEAQRVARLELIQHHLAQQKPLRRAHHAARLAIAHRWVYRQTIHRYKNTQTKKLSFFQTPSKYCIMSIIAPPPEAWIERMVERKEFSRKDAVSMWKGTAGWWGKGFTYKQRIRQIRHEREKAELLARAQAKVADGTADARTRTFALNGGYRRHADLLVGRKINRRETSVKFSAKRLEFRLQHAKGCVVGGCPLAPNDQVPLLILLEHDHINPASKRSIVTKSGISDRAREEEVKKTQCLCLWHHFVKTRQERRIRPISEIGPSERNYELAKLKATLGCTHPCHAIMPYSSLVPSGDVDDHVYAFLQVAYLLPGANPLDHNASSHLENIANGKAQVYCKFCRCLYTMAEDAHLSESPHSMQQFQLLEARFPAFVTHFREKTAGFDWISHRARTSSCFVDCISQPKAKQRAKEDVV